MGDSQVVDPAGKVTFQAPLLDAGLFVTEIDLADVTRARAAPLRLSGEYPQSVLRQLERLVRERAGIRVVDP